MFTLAVARMDRAPPQNASTPHHAARRSRAPQSIWNHQPNVEPTPAPGNANLPIGVVVVAVALSSVLVAAAFTAVIPPWPLSLSLPVRCHPEDIRSGCPKDLGVKFHPRSICPLRLFLICVRSCVNSDNPTTHRSEVGHQGCVGFGFILNPNVRRDSTCTGTPFSVAGFNCHVITWSRRGSSNPVLSHPPGHTSRICPALSAVM